MMIDPSLDELLGRAGNPYLLVVQAAKRARQMIEDGDNENEHKGQNVTIALREIKEGKIDYEIPHDGKAG